MIPPSKDILIKRWTDFYNGKLGVNDQREVARITVDTTIFTSGIQPLLDCQKKCQITIVWFGEHLYYIGEAMRCIKLLPETKITAMLYE